MCTDIHGSQMMYLTEIVDTPDVSAGTSMKVEICYRYSRSQKIYLMTLVYDHIPEN